MADIIIGLGSPICGMAARSKFCTGNDESAVGEAEEVARLGDRKSTCPRAICPDYAGLGYLDRAGTNAYGLHLPQRDTRSAAYVLQKYGIAR